MSDFDNEKDTNKDKPNNQAQHSWTKLSIRSILKAEALKKCKTLLDGGNLVIRNEGDTEDYLWQSFDYPSDTLLPGMKLGWNLQTGLERRITSWKSPDDPSIGNYSWCLMLHNYPEFYLMRGTQKYHRIGPWNGLHFSRVPNQTSNPFYEFKYTAHNAVVYASNKAEMFYSFTLKNSSVLVRVTVIEGGFQTFVWEKDKTQWQIHESTPRDRCDLYGMCGANGNCRIKDTPLWQCLKGFSPKSPPEWNTSN
ncbi:hypothetical protein Fmac_021331 [Flemingia macrophylla]|uniref:Uncharacterized protein n=1 Tax=Flemingia macrophylla TaxID=520843 RepID=A0ABD1LWJ3_9FABA